MPRPPARKSPGCAAVLLVLLGGPAAYLVWAVIFGGAEPDVRVWQTVGAAALLVATVAGLLVTLDVGDGKRPGYDLGCVALGLPLLTVPGLLLALLAEGAGIRITGWGLVVLGVLVMLGAVLNRGGPDEQDEPAEPANGQVSHLPRPASANEPVPRANRIGCSLAAVGLLALPGLSLLWLAAFDPARSHSGRVWAAVAGAALLALAAAATAAALGLGEARGRLDLGCLGLVLVLLIAPGVLLLIAANPPGGVRVVGWCLLGLAALAVLATVTRGRLDRIRSPRRDESAPEQ
ncbi:hypothetical protein M8C13_40760 [Crossiella sp. SN42]|uniref:hypothetical protein n=1 Tax=Crossiella sp. SN42 TaxID=2944808 RepID=UPI00207D3397|nr:hypothetical protein [Crossiella sp. SN42]MCO1582099.1 hypothetical protein [Crossiella sp. SN42]